MNTGQEGREPSRVLRSRDEAERSYNRLAPWYDRLSGKSEWKPVEEALALLDVRPGETVLEIGSGTGKALERLRELAGATGRVTGLDLSEGMLEVASRRLARRGISDVELLHGDALDPPLPAGFFDVVFLGFTLELFDTPELPQVTASVHRLLRDSGRVGVAALSLRRTDRPAVKIYHWAHRALPRFVDCRPIPVVQVLERGGFTIEKFHQRLMWGLPVDLLVARKAAQRAGDRR